MPVIQRCQPDAGPGPAGAGKQRQEAAQGARVPGRGGVGAAQHDGLTMLVEQTSTHASCVCPPPLRMLTPACAAQVKASDDDLWEMLGASFGKTLRFGARLGLQDVRAACRQPKVAEGCRMRMRKRVLLVDRLLACTRAGPDVYVQQGGRHAQGARARVAIVCACACASSKRRRGPPPPAPAACGAGVGPVHDVQGKQGAHARTTHARAHQNRRRCITA